MHVFATIWHIYKVSNLVSNIFFRLPQDHTYDDNHKKIRMLQIWGKLVNPYACFNAM
jgi:hypothetical protein